MQTRVPVNRGNWDCVEYDIDSKGVDVSLCFKPFLAVYDSTREIRFRVTSGNKRDCFLTAIWIFD
jgi:hypothetical protein